MTMKFTNWSIIAIGLIAVFAALNTLENIFAPLALALVAGVVLSPLTDFWEDRGFSPVIGALIGLVATLLVIGGLALVFQPVVAQLVDQAPKVWSDMQETIRSIRDVVRGLDKVAEDVNEAMGTGNGGAGTSGNEADAADVAMPTMKDAVMAAPIVFSQLLIFAGALFFFLLTRTEIYDWAARRISNRGERDELAYKLRTAERQVSRYFVTITMINFALGVATAVALQIIGLPGAILWGAVSFLLNFIVYLGPAIFLVALLFAGIAAFDGGYVVLPALSFLLLNGIEGQFVTPALVGRYMSINPLLVFLSLVFGLWLWGPIGGIVAIPLLVWILVLNKNLAEMEPVTETESTAEAGSSAS